MTKPYVLTPDEATFASVEDVVQEALRHLKDQEETPMPDVEALRRLWREGVESGDPIPADEVFDELEAKYEAMARARGL